MSDTSIVLVTGAGSGIGRAVAEAVAEGGYTVYASMRSVGGRNAGRRDDLLAWAARTGADLRVVEMDVLSEVGCRAAVDQILAEAGRLDVVVNNAGMLMSGPGEAFSPEQFARILDTNAVSWLRVNRAVLPAMRRQGRGLLVYVGSTTARLVEPFMAPYIASKAAGEALAESMGFEVAGFGVESVIVVPGAFTDGTEHFADAKAPADAAVLGRYATLMERAKGLGARIEAIDASHGGSGGVAAVGRAVRDLIALPHGRRPPRAVVDFQRKGMEDIDALVRERQAAFFEQLGIADLLAVPDGKR